MVMKKKLSNSSLTADAIVWFGYVLACGGK